MELGIYTFAEATPDPETGKTISPAQRMHNLLEEIELAVDEFFRVSPGGGNT